MALRLKRLLSGRLESLRANSPGVPQPTRLRWAFVGMSGLLTLVVAVSLLTGFLGATELAETLARGKASVLFHAMARVERGGPPSSAQLATVVEANADIGLRYVGIVHGSRVIVEAGGRTPSLLDDLAGMNREDVVRHGDVMRAIAPPPRHPGPHFPGGKAPPRRDHPRPDLEGPPRKGDRGPGRLPRMVIEFEPTEVVAMQERARRDLAIGLAAIVVLWGAAGLFWRLASQAATSEAKLAGQRHLASLGEMSAVVAHELRNPLASLKGHAQLLLEQAHEPRVARKAQRVVDEAVRLQELSHGLLEFVRSGRVERAPVDLRRLVDRAVATTEAKVEVSRNNAPTTWALDQARIVQVIINLLDNAHHAAPDAPVELSLRGERDALVFVVSDRGPGVAPEDVETIFLPFRTGRTKGTGLGLAVARRIVTLHDGTITCQARDGGGAQFVVRIPRSV